MCAKVAECDQKDPRSSDPVDQPRVRKTLAEMGFAISEGGLVVRKEDLAAANEAFWDTIGN